MRQIQEILIRMVQENGFLSAVLTDDSGFPLASSSRDTAEVSAAIALQLQRVVESARNRMGMETMNEITMYDNAGHRWVYRPFRIRDHQLILAVNVPPNISYRRATAHAIRQIQGTWTIGASSSDTLASSYHYPKGKEKKQ